MSKKLLTQASVILATVVSTSSRSRFETYRQQLKQKELPNGEMHTFDVVHSNDGRVRSSQQLCWHFLRLIFPFWLQVLWILISLTIATILVVLTPIVVKLVIDYGLSNKSLPYSWQRHFPSLASSRKLVVVTVVTIVIGGVIKSAAQVWANWYATKLSKQIQVRFRNQAFEQVLRLPLNRIEQIPSGCVVSILREDAGSVGKLMFSMLFNPWQAVIQLCLSLALLAWVDYTMLLGAAVLLLPFKLITRGKWISSILPQSHAIRKQRERIDARATEVFSGIRIVRAFSRQKREATRFVTESNFMGRQELYAWWCVRANEFVWEALLPMTSAALLFFGGLRVLDGQMTAGDLMMFLIYLIMLVNPLATLARSAVECQNSLSGLDRTLELLKEPREMTSMPNSIKANRHQISGNLCFEDVTFTYPSSNTTALSGINLCVCAGQTVALIGPSGAGKTTLSNLVARFYDPSSGRVTLDGRDLREYEVESFRSLFGIVEQDVFLFDGTVYQNIAYARRNATGVEIRAAAEAANAAEFIDQMTDGMQTVIGERGVRLSCGQRQRLAIARVILADPKVLILDEATSNLDNENETLIQKSLFEVMQGRTSFVIAHRLSTIAVADVIVVLENGRISQIGSHSDLMNQEGYYCGMVKQQIQMMRAAPLISGT